MRSLLQLINAAHGVTYRGVKKEIFLCWWLRHGEYHAMSERILRWNGVEGLRKPKPLHPPRGCEVGPYVEGREVVACHRGGHHGEFRTGVLPT